MPLWIIRPVAGPDDPRWQGRKQFIRVIVRANSPAFACLVAETLDTPEKAIEYGQEDPHLGSGFKDVMLYHVSSYSGTDYQPQGPDEILDAVERF